MSAVNRSANLAHTADNPDKPDDTVFSIVHPKAIGATGQRLEGAGKNAFRQFSRRAGRARNA
jgi:hypothetical protein